MNFPDKIVLGIGCLWVWVLTGMYLGDVNMVGIGWLTSLIVLRE